jgi:hypothetical protein
MNEIEFVEKLANTKNRDEIVEILKENSVVILKNTEDSKGSFQSGKVTFFKKDDILKNYDKAIEEVEKEYQNNDGYKTDVEMFGFNDTVIGIEEKIKSFQNGKMDIDELKEQIIEESFGIKKGSINHNKIADIELLEECFLALEDGMRNLKEKGIKATFQNDELGDYYFKIEKKFNNENNNYTSLYLKSDSLPEILDKSFKYMAFEVVEPFTEENPCFDDYANFKDNFQDKVKDVGTPIGFLKTIQLIDREDGFVFDELQDLNANKESKKIKIYFSNDDKETNYIKVFSKNQSYIMEYDNEKVYMQEIESLSENKSLIRSILLDEYSEQFGAEVFKKGENVFDKIHNDKEIIDKVKEVGNMIKEISFSDIKNYVLTETAKIEKRDKGAEPEKRLYLEKADKIIDDFLGNFEEFRNSDSAISEFIKNNKEELGIDLKDLRGDTKFETDNNIKNFFINSIKNEIKIAVSEMVYEGSFENTKTYDNKKVEDFFKKRDELTQNIFDKSFAIDFNNSKYENQIKFLETNDKSIIFNLNDKYNAGGLGSFMSSYFDKEPALARPIISKSNMINWIEKLDTKKYNIGFEVKVDKDKKETQIEIEKENKREKDF